MTHTTFKFPSQLEAERIIEQQRQRIDTLNDCASKWNTAIATLETIAQLENGADDIAHIFELVLPIMSEYGAGLENYIEASVSGLEHQLEVKNQECAQLRGVRDSLATEVKSLNDMVNVTVEDKGRIQKQYFELLEKSDSAQLENKIANLEQNLEIALQQRDRLNVQHSELLAQQIFSQSEEEFLNKLESPQEQSQKCVDATDDETKWGELKIPALPFASEDTRPAEVIEVAAVEVEPLEKRIKAFIKKLNPETTTWKDMVQYIQGDEVDFLRQLQMQRTRKHDRIIVWIPKALANHIEKWGRTDIQWVGKTWMKQAEDILEQRFQDAKNTPELTIEDAHRVSSQPEKMLYESTASDWDNFDPEESRPPIEEWESVTRNLGALFLQQDKEFAPGGAAAGMKNMLEVHLEDYAPRKQEIVALMIELLSEDEVIFGWVKDYLEQQLQPEWEAVVVGTIDKFFNRHEEAAVLTAVWVRNVVQAVFASYPTEVDAIATRMFELIAEYDDSEIIFGWVEDAHADYCKKSLFQHAA